MFPLLIVLELLAQTFEVASVRPSGPKQREIAFRVYAGGRVVATRYRLKDLMTEAYGVQPFQITGGPAWINEDPFDIDARPPENSQSHQSNPVHQLSHPNEEQKLMLQALFAERFQLKVRRVMKEGPVYLLTTESGRPLKLAESKDKAQRPWAGSIAGGGFNGDGIRGRNISMEQLAERLSSEVHRPVLDRTKLTGSFDFKYVYSASEKDEDPLASIVTSLRALGLKLVPGKGQVESLIVEHAEKPSEN